MNMSLRKPREIVKDREAECAAVLGVAKSQTWLSNWTTFSIKFLLLSKNFLLIRTCSNEVLTTSITPPNLPQEHWVHVGSSGYGMKKADIPNISFETEKQVLLWARLSDGARERSKEATEATWQSGRVLSQASSEQRELRVNEQQIQTQAWQLQHDRWVPHNHESWAFPVSLSAGPTQSWELSLPCFPFCIFASRNPSLSLAQPPLMSLSHSCLLFLVNGKHLQPN